MVAGRGAVNLAQIVHQAVIPAKAGIQQSENHREADKIMLLPHLRGEFLINWIPACAGMTRFSLMDDIC